MSELLGVDRSTAAKRLTQPNRRELADEWDMPVSRTPWIE
jgi:hypothetical protein